MRGIVPTSVSPLALIAISILVRFAIALNFRERASYDTSGFEYAAKNLRLRRRKNRSEVGDLQVSVDRSFKPVPDEALPGGCLERAPDPGERLRSIRAQVLDVTA